MPPNLSRLPNEIGVWPFCLAAASIDSNSVERLRHGLDHVAVVEDADDLALLGDAVEVAGAELLAVGGELVEVEQRLRPAVVPAVGVRVGVERLEQPALDELAHDLAALVRLHDVRRVGAGDRELERRLEVGERLRDALDLHVRVRRHERLVEARDLLLLAAADLLVPDRQRDVAGLGDVDLGGVLLRLVGLLVVVGRVASRGAAARDQGGREEQQSERSTDHARVSL